MIAVLFGFALGAGVPLLALRLWVCCRRERAYIDQLRSDVTRRARKHRDCRVPPLGWRCTRAAGHDGPCAAIPDWMRR